METYGRVMSRPKVGDSNNLPCMCKSDTVKVTVQEDFFDPQNPPRYRGTLTVTSRPPGGDFRVVLVNVLNTPGNKFLVPFTVITIPISKEERRYQRERTEQYHENLTINYSNKIYFFKFKI